MKNGVLSHKKLRELFLINLTVVGENVFKTLSQHEILVPFGDVSKLFDEQTRHFF